MTEVPELWFLIRADANATIGIGHVMRCLALAEWARDSGFKAVLCTKFPHSFLQQRLEALGGTYLLIPESEKPPGNTYAHSSWLKGNELEDAEATLAVIQKLGLPSPSFIVVDHYALGAPWEKYARKVAPIMVIDDLNDRDHCCEILVDQNYGKSLLSYTQLTPSTTKGRRPGKLPKRTAPEVFP